MNNLEDVDMSEAGELLENFPVAPAGECESYMESSERKPTKDGQGELLLTIWRLIDPKFEGVQIYHRFNLWNKNPTARQIAKAEWNAVCLATVGQPAEAVKDSAWVHTKRCIVTLALEEYPEGSGKWKNVLVFRKGAIRALGQPAPATAAPAAPAPAANAAASNAPAKAAAAAPAARSAAPPWANKK